MEQSDSPCIRVCLDISRDPVTLLLDTGATISLLKESKIENPELIDRTDVLNILGITEEKIRALGSVKANLHGYEAKFYIVPDDFAIPCCGILGHNFFLLESATINYKDCTLELEDFKIEFCNKIVHIPPNSSRECWIKVLNNEKSEGFVEKCEIEKGVFFEKTFVKNENGKIKVIIQNTCNHEVRILTPCCHIKNDLNSVEQKIKIREKETKDELEKVNDLINKDKIKQCQEYELLCDEILNENELYELKDNEMIKENKKYNEKELKHDEIFTEDDLKCNEILEDSDIEENILQTWSNENEMNKMLPIEKLNEELMKLDDSKRDETIRLFNKMIKTMKNENDNEKVEINSQNKNNEKLNNNETVEIITNAPVFLIENSSDSEDELTIDYDKQEEFEQEIFSREIVNAPSKTETENDKNFSIDENEIKYWQQVCETVLFTSENLKRRMQFEIGDNINSTNLNFPNEVKVHVIDKSLDSNVQTRLEENKNYEPGELTIEQRLKSLHDENKINSSRIKEITEILDFTELSEKETEALHELIENNNDCFHLPDDVLGYTNAGMHRIFLTDDIPVRVKQFPLPVAYKEEIKKQMRDLFDKKIIKSSISPYNFPLWVVKKKPNSKGVISYRVVVDLRELNLKTIHDAFPLPNITEILNMIGPVKYFSTLDLASGFHQILLDPRDSEKTAFSTEDGHFEFQRMCFGLRNAPQTFQRIMTAIFDGLISKIMFCYLDDAVIYSNSLEEHIQHINIVLDRLRKANLKLQTDKCHFFCQKVTYCGHVISSSGINPDPRKLEAVRSFPCPKTPKNIKQFLGLAGYYRRFIHQFAQIAKPLSHLLKNETPFVWGDEQQNAFETLKDKLCEAPLLQFPDFDKPFVLTTDASGYCIGAILSQGPIGQDKPIAYMSRTLHDNEVRLYSTYEKEALAIFDAIKYFRHYLLGRSFKIITDHLPLVWMKSKKDPTTRLAKWILQHEDYDFTIIHKAGKNNLAADALSRNPVRPVRSSQRLKDKRDKRLSQNQQNPDVAESNSDIPSEPKGTSVKRKRGRPRKPAKANTKTKRLIKKASPRLKSKRKLTQGNTKRQSSVSISSSDESSNEESQILNFPDDPIIIEPKPFGKQIVEINEKLVLRKDNCIIFLYDDGKILDQGSMELYENKLLADFNDLELGKVSKQSFKNKFQFAIPLSPYQQIDELDILTNRISVCIKSLVKMISDENLKSISIAYSKEILNVPWEFILKELKLQFLNIPCKLIICKGLKRIPNSEERRKIIEIAHDSVVGGHRGVNKTYKRIRQKYNWDNLKADVQSYINQCLPCQLKKLVRVKTKMPMTITDTPNMAMEKIAMDIVGPLPISRLGNKYILTIQCQLSKLCMAIPLAEATAITIADMLIKRWICVFGSPRVILTDQGTNFLSSLVKQIAKRFKIKQVKTTAFHPQSNGSLERSHHVLGEYLKQFAENDDQWDQWLELATFSYNVQTHEGTLYSPYQLVFGTIAREPSTEAIRDEEQLLTYDNYITNLVTRLRSLQTIARENLLNSKFKSKKYYDRNVNELNLKKGDFVFLLSGPKPKKLQPHYSGPFRILDVLEDGNIKIEVKKKIKIVHPNRLKFSKINFEKQHD